MKQSFARARHSAAPFIFLVRWFPALLCLWVPSTFALAPITFSAEVSIDVDGHLHVTGPVIAPLDESGRGALANALTRWRFFPAERDGHQVPATTTVYGEWAGRGRGEPRYLRHGPKPILSVPPRRPPGPNSLSLETRTLVEVQVAPSGLVANTRILAVASFPDLRDQALRMAAAAEESLRHWHFQPEQINGEPISSTVIVPIGFRRRDGMPEQQWTIHVGSPEHLQDTYWAQHPNANPGGPQFIDTREAAR